MLCRARGECEGLLVLSIFAFGRGNDDLLDDRPVTPTEDEPETTILEIKKRTGPAMAYGFPVYVEGPSQWSNGPVVVNHRP